MKPDLPLYVSVLFLALVLMLLIFIFRNLYSALDKTYQNKSQVKKIFGISLTMILLWLVFLAAISQINFLNNFSAIPPHILLVLFPPIISAVILVSSKGVGRLLSTVPLQYLIYIQTFRVAMELILWLLFCNNIIPVQMTFEGRNYDILTGLSALFTAYYYERGVQFFNHKWFLILWNITGLLLLANIVIIAILSTPLPFRYFTNEPVNTVVFYFPFVWLPGFVVPVAFAMHLFSLKKIISGKQAE